LSRVRGLYSLRERGMKRRKKRVGRLDTLNMKYKGEMGEAIVERFLQKKGFIVYRHPDSKTPDLLAYHRRWKLFLLVEVKYTDGDEVIIDRHQLEVLRDMGDFFRSMLATHLIFTVPCVLVVFKDRRVIAGKRVNDEWDGKSNLKVRWSDGLPF